jgi:Myb/SANT-like DNA-binding domain
LPFVTFSAWTHTATLLLIASYSEVAEEFTGSKKKKLWELVAGRMSAHGYTYNGTDCDNKWRSLTKTYRAHVDNSRRTGRGGGKKWAYFDLIDGVVGKSASSLPISVAASTARMPAAASSSSNSSTLVLASSSSSVSSVLSTTTSADPSVSSLYTRKRSQPPGWFTAYMNEFKESHDKRHKDFMEHLTAIEEEQKKRTDLLKALTEKLLQ